MTERLLVIMCEKKELMYDKKDRVWPIDSLRVSRFFIAMRSEEAASGRFCR